MTYQQGFGLALVSEVIFNRCTLEVIDSHDEHIVSRSHRQEQQNIRDLSSLTHLEGVDWYIDLTSPYGTII